MNELQPLLLHVLIQLAVIIIAARSGAWLMGRIGQPQVVGEIVAGLALGPSLLGRVAPYAVEFLFPRDTAVVFVVLSELGLVLLMFLIGLEFDFSHLRHVGRTAVGVAGAGIAVPFFLGVALALWLHPLVAAEVTRTGFVSIVAVALSITAIPILGRIMIELNIHRTPLGTLTITAAAIDDAVGWILLAGVSATILGYFEPLAVVHMMLMTTVFVAGCWFVARPLLIRCTDYLLRRDNGELSLVGLSAVLIMVLLAAAATNEIGIFSIFGPFVLGAVLSDRRDFGNPARQRLREMVYALFLPIFFTCTGLRTNVGLLESSLHWLVCGLVVVTAVAGKMIGCGVGGPSGWVNVA